MNTCKTIDYKISIYPSIASTPYEVILTARVVLPDNNILYVQETVSRGHLEYGGDVAIEKASAAFAERLSGEIYHRIRNEARQEIYRQNE